MYAFGIILEDKEGNVKEPAVEDKEGDVKEPAVPSSDKKKENYSGSLWVIGYFSKSRTHRLNKTLGTNFPGLISKNTWYKKDVQCRRASSLPVIDFHRPSIVLAIVFWCDGRNLCWV